MGKPSGLSFMWWSTHAAVTRFQQEICTSVARRWRNLLQDVCTRLRAWVCVNFKPTRSTFKLYTLTCVFPFIFHHCGCSFGLLRNPKRSETAQCLKTVKSVSLSAHYDVLYNADCMVTWRNLWVNCFTNSSFCDPRVFVTSRVSPRTNSFLNWHW